jgi:Pyruvate/2-oxoacid:ferredoxin oxidoreductase delta subunit
MPLLPTGSLSMREYIKDGFNSPSKKVVSPDDINKGYTVHMQKPSPKQTSVHRRTKGFVQIYSTLSASQARLEADRCLVCGSCSGCMNCFYFCPDSSIILGTQIEIDYDYCKGCGICQTECPTGYISMETEETE